MPSMNHVYQNNQVQHVVVKLIQYPSVGPALYSSELSSLKFEYNRQKTSVTAIIESGGDLTIPDTIEFAEDDRIVPADRRFFGTGVINVTGLVIKRLQKDLLVNINKYINNIEIERTNKKIQINAKDNPCFVSENGCLYDKNKKELIHYYSEKTNDDVVNLPESLEKIRSNAFSGLYIRKLILPKGILIVPSLFAEVVNVIDCKGPISKIEEHLSSRSVDIIAVNNYMHNILWVWNNFVSIPHKVLTKMPVLKDTRLMKNTILLHEKVSLERSMKQQIDYLPLTITIDKDTTDIEEYERNGNHYIKISLYFRIIIKKYIIESYDDCQIERGSEISFEADNVKFDKSLIVFDSVDEIQQRKGNLPLFLNN
jgi:hypothetical protein